MSRRLHNEAKLRGKSLCASRPNSTSLSLLQEVSSRGLPAASRARKTRNLHSAVRKWSGENSQSHPARSSIVLRAARRAQGEENQRDGGAARADAGTQAASSSRGGEGWGVRRVAASVPPARGRWRAGRRVWRRAGVFSSGWTRPGLDGGGWTAVVRVRVSDVGQQH